MYTAQVVFQNVSGMPEDEYVNTLHFDGPAPADFAALTNAIHEFYDLTGGIGGLAVSNFLSPVIDRAQLVVAKFYDRTAGGTPTGPPVATGSFLIEGNTTGNALPGEVACVLSFYADNALGQVLQRGRIYVGPLTVGAISYLGNGIPRVHQNLRTAMTAAAVRLRDSVAISANPWSTIHTNPVGGALTAMPVTNGFVDNGFDTQRRRGVAADFRNTF